MKKKFVCLMIAGLSLIATPYQMSAGTVSTVKENTEEKTPPIKVNPALAKKINAFKKNHPGMFSKKDNQSTENTAEASKNRDGGVLYISGGALILIIILLIILL